MAVQPLSYELTYEQLLEQKLNRISNDYNKRPGDLIYTSVAPNSYEIIQMLAALNSYRDLVFGDTAPREELIRIAAERGITINNATFALRRAVFNIDVPIGSRFSIENVNYTVVERISLGQFNLRAETAGEIGNAYFGQLIPIGDINGLQSAQLTDVLIPGQDEEETEAFRLRFRNSFDASSFGGNRADYKTKVTALEGVGGVRIYRAQYGAGTVGLSIINSQYKAPSSTLIQQVQEAVDPIGQQGEGVGIAPIDHVVTVTGVTNEVINVQATITFESGYNADIVRPLAEEAINSYFQSLGEEWARANTKSEDDTGLIVRISQIELRILSLDGVLDIANTTVNGRTGNINLTVDKIPSLGTLVI